MERTFTVTCTCGHSFPVDYEIRFVDVELECPACRRKMRVEEAAARRALGLRRLGLGSQASCSPRLPSSPPLSRATPGRSDVTAKRRLAHLASARSS